MFISFKTIKRLLVTVVMFAALAPASASAMIDRSDSVATRFLPATPVAAPTSHSAGFQWGDAGIGAACALVLVAAGGGLALNARRRSRKRHLAAV